jgi:hypothetical protein
MYYKIYGVGSSPWVPQSLSFVVTLVFTVFFIACTVYLYCFVYVYLFLFCLYKCKDYCHRVKTQLQLVVIIIIIIITTTTTLICILCWLSNLQCMTDIRMTIMFIIRALNIVFSKFLSQGGCGESWHLSRPPPPHQQSTSNIKSVSFLFLCYVASTLKGVKSHRNRTIYGCKIRIK